MTDVLPWMIAHIACVAAHFAFMATSTFAFINPLESSLSWDSEKEWESNRLQSNLAWMASGTATFIMFTNGFYLAVLWKLEQRTIESTSNNRRFIKKMALALGTALNCCYAFADFAFARASGRYAADHTAFAVMRVFAGIAGVTIVLTIIFDLLKIYELFRQKREAYDVLNSMEPDDWEI